MKVLNAQALETFLKDLEQDFDLRAPVLQHDGTRALGRPDEEVLAIPGGRIPAKPTSVFFPQFERVFTEREGQVLSRKQTDKALLVVGWTAQDAECLAFIDKFFADKFRDDLYFAKREGAVIVVVSGRCGPDGEFQKIAGGNCDLELIYDGDNYILVSYTDLGRTLAERAPEISSTESIEALQRESAELPTVDQETLEKASELLLNEKIPDDFWTEIGQQCIACTACNLVCPTCTCFDVFDWRYADETVRCRVWDSCQTRGFTREASGHNPRGSEDVRTRHRIFHKIGGDVTRWGHLTCMLCGRCDEVCPTGIGIKAVTEAIVRRYGE